MLISIIVAISENGVIGRDETLPWHLSADLKRFKKLTMGHCMIMGRKTYESIGRPLPGRTSIILTSNSQYDAPGCLVAGNLDDAVRLAKEKEAASEGPVEPRADDVAQVFIIGGRSVYAAAESIADRIYLTRVHAQVEGDTVFPDVNWDLWKLTEETHHTQDDKNDHDFSFQIYQRAQKPIAS